MIINPQVPLPRLVLSLSEALDSLHPNIADHQQRVAYIATSIARHMGFKREDLIDLFHAAALHDIGLIGVENRLKTIALGQLEATAWHGEIGFELLRRNSLFEGAAEIVRHHHLRWEDRGVAERNGGAAPLASHILVLSDDVERMINRTENVLLQRESILARTVAQRGKQFNPDCVDALRDVAAPEAFWLDACSPQVYSVLLRQIDWPTLVVDEVSVRPIAEAFGRIVDAASKWTMVHSGGVTATACALAERLDFSAREVGLMRAAGCLHDLGKVTVPSRVLDKPAKLDRDETAVMRGHTYHTFRILNTIGGMPQISEWAAFHHERLDGTGYPFRHNKKELMLGSRVMAVADVCTAVAEDRPYRKGMSRNGSLKVLDDLVKGGALDGELVKIVRRDYEAIDSQRRSEQDEYRRDQIRMTDLMHT